MDIVRLKELCTLAETRVGSVSEYIRTKQKVDIEWNLITAPIYEAVSQANTYTNVKCDVDENAKVVIDSGVTPLDGARRAAVRFHSLMPYLIRLLEIYDEKKNSDMVEAVNALTTFRDRVQEAMDCYLQLREYWKNAFPDMSPTTGLGDIRIQDPSYVAVIVGKLDEILGLLETRPQVAGPQLPVTVQESECLTLLKKILALLEKREGTGLPPVTATEGIVGEFMMYLPWHSTGGAGGLMYGTAGQPGLLLGNWQYDALYTPVHTGTYVTIAVPGGFAKHITVLDNKTFWISVATGEMPTKPIPVVLSDLDAFGNRVIQRLTV